MSERKPYFLSGEDGAAWRAAWRGLAQLGYKVPNVADGSAPCPSCNGGECWQYMGTWPDEYGERPGQRGGYVHSFRHRDYPGRGRLSVSVPVEGVDRQDDALGAGPLADAILQLRQPPPAPDLPALLHVLELQAVSAVAAGATEGDLLGIVAAACFGGDA